MFFSDFKNGQITILVATDVASRGIGNYVILDNFSFDGFLKLLSKKFDCCILSYFNMVGLVFELT